jgi:hypothetical protein
MSARRLGDGGRQNHTSSSSSSRLQQAFIDTSIIVSFFFCMYNYRVSSTVFSLFSSVSFFYTAVVCPRVFFFLLLLRWFSCSAMEHGLSHNVLLAVFFNHVMARLMYDRCCGCGVLWWCGCVVDLAERKREVISYIVSFQFFLASSASSLLWLWLLLVDELTAVNDKMDGEHVSTLV